MGVLNEPLGDDADPYLLEFVKFMKIGVTYRLYYYRLWIFISMILIEILDVKFDIKI